MSNRNFDSRVIIQRLQDRNQARNLYLYNTTGNGIIHNPQTTNPNASRITNYNTGSQTMYFRGLLGGNIYIQAVQHDGSTVTVPSSPIITAIVSGDAKLYLYFIPPVSDGGSPITDYEYSIDGGSNFQSIGATTDPLIIQNGLINGQLYFVVIRAVNSAGSGSNSNTLEGIPYSPGWATNIGGTGSEEGRGITTDTFGNIYATGYFTTSTVVNNFSSISGGIIGTSSIGTLVGSGQDAYIVKYNSSGIAQWATNIGGTDSDQGLGITTDTFGNVYATGYFTTSTVINNFSSISGGIIGTSSIGTLRGSGNTDAYIVKYNSSGIAQWATNIGGTSFDQGLGITTDTFGNVYATGYFTASTVVNNFSSISGGIIGTSSIGTLVGSSLDAYIVKYNSSGIAQWATNIGGTGGRGYGITADSFGNIYATGYFNTSTVINNFSSISGGIIGTSSIGTLRGSGSFDAYIVKYNSSGIAQWATNIGGTSFDLGLGITTDAFGNVYATGYFTTSTVVNNFSSISGGIIGTSSIGTLVGSGINTDAYIVKYNSSGIAQWATNISGGSTEQGRGITTDTFGNVYATGYFTTSTVINNFSSISGGIIGTSSIGTLRGSGGQDAYIVKYNSSGIAQWATNIGGTGQDQGLGITTDTFGNVYATGYFNGSANINSFNSISSGIIITQNGGTFVGSGSIDAYIIKLNSSGQFIGC